MNMPKKRMPLNLWFLTREKVWLRDKCKCTHCYCEVDLNKCHIDHIISGKYGTNNMSNLRTLCKRCHVLRLDIRHRGMISRALSEELIPPNWRELTWD